MYHIPCRVDIVVERVRLIRDHDVLRIVSRVVVVQLLQLLLLVDLPVNFPEFLAESGSGPVQILVVVNLDLILLVVIVLVVDYVLDALVGVKIGFEVGSNRLAHYFGIVKLLLLILLKLRIVKEPAAIPFLVYDATRIEIEAVSVDESFWAHRGTTILAHSELMWLNIP